MVLLSAQSQVPGSRRRSANSRHNLNRTHQAAALKKMLVADPPYNAEAVTKIKTAIEVEPNQNSPHVTFNFLAPLGKRSDSESGCPRSQSR